MCHSYIYSTNIITKKAIEFIWHYISNNRLMAAKQKMSFQHCIILGKGKSAYRSNGAAAGDSFKKFCLMFKPEDKLIQMSLTTARDRAITVSIAHRKWDY